MTAPPGWYTDPANPAALRQWDGAAWTHNTQAFPPPQQLPQQLPPPAPGSQPGGPGTVSTRTERTGGPTYDGKINDLFVWFNRSILAVVQRFGRVSLLALLAAASFVPAYLYFARWLQDLVIISNPDDTVDVSGFELRWLIAAGVSVFVAVGIVIASWLAATQQLYTAHIGQRVGLAQSIAAGIRSSPLMMVVSLFAVLIPLLPIALLVVDVVFIHSGPFIRGLQRGIFIMQFATLISYVVGGFLYFRYIVMLPVALVVVPKETSAIRAATQAARGWFWPIVGRMLLLSLVASFVAAAGQILLQGSLFFWFASSAGGEGSALGANDVESRLDLAAELPPIGLVVGAIIAGGYFLFMSQAVVVSGAAGLYADVSGPNRFGHSYVPA